MAIVTLTFPHEINTSTQVGDIVYYVPTTPIGATNQWAQATTPHDSAARNDVRKIGVILTITSSPTVSVITANMSAALSALYGPPQLGDFIMFSKDNKVNVGSLLGYYASIKLRNSSKDLAELFMVNCDFSESSK